MSNPLEDLAEEVQRQQAYGAAGQSSSSAQTDSEVIAALLGAPLGGKYLPDADTYIYYSVEAPHNNTPSILAFVVAASDRHTPTRTFRYASDFTTRTICWLAYRKGDWPVIPVINEAFGPCIRSVVVPTGPSVGDAGGSIFIHRIRGEYTYVLTTPTIPSVDTILSPFVPFLATDSGRLTITADNTQDLFPEP